MLLRVLNTGETRSLFIDDDIVEVSGSSLCALSEITGIMADFEKLFE